MKQLIDFDQLERIALAASQGPWSCDCRNVNGPKGDDLDAVSSWSTEEFLGFELHGLPVPGRGDVTGPDAAFIVAFQPSVAVELVRLARIGALSLKLVNHE